MTTNEIISAVRAEQASKAYYVNDGMESKDGSSGWDIETFGPFATEAEAEAKAREQADEGYSSMDGEVRLVEVVFGDRSNYCEGHGLFSWRSNEETEDESEDE